MLYVLAILCPPLAVLMAGRFWASVLNFVFCATIVLGPIAIVHAWFVVKDYEAERTRPVSLKLVNRVKVRRRRRA